MPCLELKSASRGNDLVRKILDVVEQLVLQERPVVGIEDLSGLGEIAGDQSHLDLRVRAVDRRPGFRGLQAQALHAGDEFADDELEIFLVAFTGDVPCH